MNQLQVRDREPLTSTELLAEWDTISLNAVKARTGLPRPIAALPLLGLPQPVGRQPLAVAFHDPTPASSVFGVVNREAV